jgi:hypothetical protein
MITAEHLVNEKAAKEAHMIAVAVDKVKNFGDKGDHPLVSFPDHAMIPTRPPHFDCGDCSELAFANKGMDDLDPPQPPGEQQADRFNEGKVDLTLIDPTASEGLARVLEFGANKYSRDNWRKGLPELNILASIARHYSELLKGNQTDTDSGLPHIDHIAANAMFLSYYQKMEIGK